MKANGRPAAKPIRKLSPYAALPYLRKTRRDSVRAPALSSQAEIRLGGRKRLGQMSHPPILRSTLARVVRKHACGLRLSVTD
jgi:hypothetical protein